MDLENKEHRLWFMSKYYTTRRVSQTKTLDDSKNSFPQHLKDQFSYHRTGFIEAALSAGITIPLDILEDKSEEIAPFIQHRGPRYLLQTMYSNTESLQFLKSSLSLLIVTLAMLWRKIPVPIQSPSRIQNEQQRREQEWAAETLNLIADASSVVICIHILVSTHDQIIHELTLQLLSQIVSVSEEALYQMLETPIIKSDDRRERRVELIQDKLLGPYHNNNSNNKSLPIQAEDSKLSSSLFVEEEDTEKSLYSFRNQFLQEAVHFSDTFRLPLHTSNFQSMKSPKDKHQSKSLPSISSPPSSDQLSNVKNTIFNEFSITQSSLEGYDTDHANSNNNSSSNNTNISKISSKKINRSSCLSFMYSCAARHPNHFGVMEGCAAVILAMISTDSSELCDIIASTPICHIHVEKKGDRHLIQVTKKPASKASGMIAIGSVPSSPSRHARAKSPLQHQPQPSSATVATATSTLSGHTKSTMSTSSKDHHLQHQHDFSLESWAGLKLLIQFLIRYERYTSDPEASSEWARVTVSPSDKKRLLKAHRRVLHATCELISRSHTVASYTINLPGAVESIQHCKDLYANHKELSEALMRCNGAFFLASAKVVTRALRTQSSTASSSPHYAEATESFERRSLKTLHGSDLLATYSARPRYGSFVWTSTIRPPVGSPGSAHSDNSEGKGQTSASPSPSQEINRNRSRSSSEDSRASGRQNHPTHKWGAYPPLLQEGLSGVFEDDSEDNQQSFPDLSVDPSSVSSCTHDSHRYSPTRGQGQSDSLYLLSRSDAANLHADFFSKLPELPSVPGKEAFMGVSTVIRRAEESLCSPARPRTTQSRDPGGLSNKMPIQLVRTYSARSDFRKDSSPKKTSSARNQQSPKNRDRGHGRGSPDSLWGTAKSSDSGGLSKVLPKTYGFGLELDGSSRLESADTGFGYSESKMPTKDQRSRRAKDMMKVSPTRISQTSDLFLS